MESDVTYQISKTIERRDSSAKVRSLSLLCVAASSPNPHKVVCTVLHSCSAIHGLIWPPRDFKWQKTLWSGALMCVNLCVFINKKLLMHSSPHYVKVIPRSLLSNMFFWRVLFISRALGCQVHLVHIILKRHCYGHLDLSATPEDCHLDKTKLWFILLFFSFMFSSTKVKKNKQMWSAKLWFCNIICVQTELFSFTVFLSTSWTWTWSCGTYSGHKKSTVTLSRAPFFLWITTDKLLLAEDVYCL